MDTIARITKNTVVLLIARIISIILGLFYTIYTARYLGTEGYGTISFALALAGIFCVFADFGLTTLITREISKNKSLSNEYFSNITILKIPLIIIASIFIIILVYALGYKEKTIIVVFLITISYIISSFTSLFNSIFQAYEKMEYNSIGTVINSVVMLIGALIAISLNVDIISFALIYCISNVMVFIYCILICFTKFFSFKFVFNPEFCKKIIKEAWPMGAMALCIIIYFRISTVILSASKGEASVGLFSAAYTLSEMTTIIPAIFISSLFPVISKYYSTSKSSFIFTYEKSVKYLIYIALPMAMIITIWAEPIVFFVYGHNFSGSVISLQILIWAAAIMYVTIVLGTVFVTANLQMVNMKITIVSAFLNIVLNLLAIPRYGYVGASFVTVITEGFGLILGIYILNKNEYKINVFKIFLTPLIGMIIACIAYIIMAELHFNIIVINIICIMLYSLIVCIKGIDEEDMRLIGKILKPIGHIKTKVKI